MDWQEQLRRFREDNPELPEGNDIPDPGTEPKVKLPRLDVILDKKGRGGKTATIVCGFECDDAALRDIAARLKSRLGTGGSARGGEILIQGDRRSDVARLLGEMGYPTRVL